MTSNVRRTSLNIPELVQNFGDNPKELCNALYIMDRELRTEKAIACTLQARLLDYEARLNDFLESVNKGVIPFKSPVIELVQCGYTNSEIHSLTGIPLGTIASIKSRFKELINGS